jgi:hypothetical protein
MSMTPAQIQILKPIVMAEPALASANLISDYQFIMDWLNAPSSPIFYVYRSYTPVSEIFDAVNHASFTPNDAADGTSIYTNRILVCQTKQMAFQNLILGANGTMATGKVNIRKGLKDSVQAIPSGNSGALVDAGWAAIKTVITRTTTRAEQFLSVGAGTLANPADVTFEGLTTVAEVAYMRD